MSRRAFIAGLAWAMLHAVPAGAAVPPTFSALTPAEAAALGRLEAAQAADGDALLTFAILTSGDVRDEPGVEARRRRVLDFAAAHRAELLALAPRARGERLLALMWREHNPVDGPLVSYDFAQSRLTTLLDTGVFNCASSALLYGLLAHGVGLDVRGVLLETHAFIELRLPEGPVDVETTSPRGFALPHDDAFFERQAASGESSTMSYDKAQYDAREIVPLRVLVAWNAILQHTKPERMDAADAARLIELGGLLAPEDRTLSLAWMRQWGARGQTLFNTDPPASAALFDRAAGLLEARGARWPDDPEVVDALAGVDLWRAQVLAWRGDVPGALARLASVLARAAADSPRARLTRHRLVEIAQRAAGAEAFEAAAALIDVHAAAYRATPDQAAMPFELWVRHMGHLIEADRFEAALEASERALAWSSAVDATRRRAVSRARASAFQQLAHVAATASAWAEALRRLEQAVQASDDPADAVVSARLRTDVLARRAVEHTRAGRFTEGVDDARAAMSGAPEGEAAQHSRGVLAFTLRHRAAARAQGSDWAGADADLVLAHSVADAEADRRDIRAHRVDIALAEAHASATAGDLASAIARLSAAVELAGDDAVARARARRQLARAHWQAAQQSGDAGRWDEAIAGFGRARAVADDDADRRALATNLAQTYIRRARAQVVTDERGAAAGLAECLEAIPDDADCRGALEQLRGRLAGGAGGDTP